VEEAQTRPARRRPAERPAEILEAAATVFAQQGYDRATTREIAALAGVSEGTLYRYFDSKRDILLAVIDQTGESWMHDLDDIEPGTFDEVLTQMMAQRMHAANRHPLTILTLQQAMLDPEVGRHFDVRIAEAQDHIMERFRQLVEAGALRPIAPFVAEEAFGSIIMGLTIGMELATRGWHREPLPPEEISRAMIDVLMNGLRPRVDGASPRPAADPTQSE
jgi:AcrR family transcriptional regulator